MSPWLCFPEGSYCLYACLTSALYLIFSLSQVSFPLFSAVALYLSECPDHLLPPTAPTLHSAALP